MRVDAQIICWRLRASCRASTNSTYIKPSPKPPLCHVSPRLRTGGVDFLDLAGHDSRNYRNRCSTIARFTYFVGTFRLPPMIIAMR